MLDRTTMAGMLVQATLLPGDVDAIQRKRCRVAVVGRILAGWAKDYDRQFIAQNQPDSTTG